EPCRCGLRTWVTRPPEVTMTCRCPNHGTLSADEDLTVGMVIPLQGSAGIFGPSCEAVTHVGIDTINAAGGILGRRVRPLFIDGGADPDHIARHVHTLVRSGRVQAVTGWHISRVRQH